MSNTSAGNLRISFSSKSDYEQGEDSDRCWGNQRPASTGTACVVVKDRYAGTPKKLQNCANNSRGTCILFSANTAELMLSRLRSQVKTFGKSEMFLFGSRCPSTQSNKGRIFDQTANPNLRFLQSCPQRL